MADMSILETLDFSHELCQTQFQDSKPKWVVLDSNWKPSALHEWIKAAKAVGANVAFEPVSAAKSTRLFSPPNNSSEYKAKFMEPIKLGDTRNRKQYTKNQHLMPVFPVAHVTLATPNALEVSVKFP